MFDFGDAGTLAPTGSQPLETPVVGMAATPDGKGYWLVAADGGVSAFGDAGFFGSMGGSPVNKPIVGMASTPDGKGYWLVAADGGVFAFGDAGFFGSMGGSPVNKPVVGMAATPGGKGYWLVAADGGVFAFGDAGFLGSTGSQHLSAPVVGMGPTLDGTGYWLVAADGGVFAFGDAGFFGSTGSRHLNAPVVGMASTSDGKGYWLAGADAGVFAFGDAGFDGSAVSLRPPQPVVAITSADPVLGVATTELGPAYSGNRFTGSLTAIGGTPPYTWSITAGALPPGLTLDPSGTISGVPTATGSSTFTVMVRDGNGRPATSQLTLGVVGAVRVVGGGDSVCALLTTTGLACWGEGTSGQLGDGSFYGSDPAGSAYPVPVLGVDGNGSLSGVTSLATDGQGFCAVLISGGVDCWGYGYDGEIGDGTYDTTGPDGEAVPTPVVGVGGVGLLTGVDGLVGGTDNYCARMATGGVVCWGSGQQGVLGDGDLYTGIHDGSATPVAVEGVGGGGLLSGVTNLATDGQGFCAVLSSGGADCWGVDDGLLGDGNSSADGAGSATPVAVEGVGGAGLLAGVTAVNGASDHYCALLTSGGVDCWGQGANGQLGGGSTYVGATYPGSATPVQVEGVGGSGLLGGVVSLTSELAATCAVLGSGTVDCWGDDTNGALGDGSRGVVPAFSDTPVQVVGVQGLGMLGGAGAVVSFGPPGEAAGFCAVQVSGSMACWGDSSFNELGGATDTGVPNAVIGVGGSAPGASDAAAYGNGLCAALVTGGVMCWGEDTVGQAGNGLVTISGGAFPPVQVQLNAAPPASSPLVVTSTGLSAAVAGDTYLEGLEAQGGSPPYRWSVATGTLPSGLVLASSGTVSGIPTSAGVSPLTVEVTDHSGRTASLALTLTVQPDLSGAVQVISTGEGFCALLASGGVDCWGSSPNGQLGDGTFTIGSAMGSDVPVPVAGVGGVGVLTGVSRLFSNNLTVCALLTSGGVDCWGGGTNGQLGDGSFTATGNQGSAVPVEVVGVGGTGLLSGVASLSTGHARTICALLLTGRVDCWGNDANGGLGGGTFITTGVKGSAVPVPVVGVGGTGLLSGVTALVSSALGECALLASGGVDCWGYDLYGGLGDGVAITTGSQGSATPVPVVGVGGTGTLGGVEALAATLQDFCALVDSGGVDCWGSGQDGVLGDGEAVPSPPANSTNPDPLPVVGDGGTGTLSGVVGLTSYADSVCAIGTGGTVSCWGQMSSTPYGSVVSSVPVETVGPGGTGDLEGVTSLALNPGGNVCALLPSTTVDCWGTGVFGELGNGDYAVNAVPPAAVAGIGGDGVLGGVASLVGDWPGSVGYCALLTSGQVACWGEADRGGLGDGTLSLLNHPGSADPVLVEAPGG